MNKFEANSMSAYMDPEPKEPAGEKLEIQREIDRLRDEYIKLEKTYDSVIGDNPEVQDELTEEFVERQNQLNREIEALEQELKGVEGNN